MKIYQIFNCFFLGNFGGGLPSRNKPGATAHTKS